MPSPEQYEELRKQAEEQKRQAERVFIKAAIAWRKRETGEHCEYEAMVAALDRLIALG